VDTRAIVDGRCGRESIPNVVPLHVERGVGICGLRISDTPATHAKSIPPHGLKKKGDRKRYHAPGPGVPGGAEGDKPGRGLSNRDSIAHR